jgi:hypothetical protein
MHKMQHDNLLGKGFEIFGHFLCPSLVTEEETDSCALLIF